MARKVVPFGEYDFHLTAVKPEPSSAPPIEMDFAFVESVEGEWPDAIVQGLDTTAATAVAAAAVDGDAAAANVI